MPIFRPTLAAMALSLVLAACGTTYDVARPDSGDLTTARRMFAEERASGKVSISADAGIARAQRAAARVQPAAERYCRDQGLRDCSFQVTIDRSAKEANAYQHYKSGRPVVTLTVPLLKETKNDDEVAFILGHEFGHHIAGHLGRKQSQAIAGAILGGVVAAATDDRYIAQGMAVGGGLGGLAYSQSYELEADVLGTEISRLARYDAVKGARFFARSGGDGGGGGLALLNTHPANAERLATVLATQRAIDRNGGLTRR